MGGVSPALNLACGFPSFKIRHSREVPTTPTARRGSEGGHFSFGLARRRRKQTKKGGLTWLGRHLGTEGGGHEQQAQKRSRDLHVGGKQGMRAGSVPAGLGFFAAREALHAFYREQRG